MSIAIILLIAALICFGLAAAGVSSRINLTALGLALLTVNMLLGGAVLK